MMDDDDDEIDAASAALLITCQLSRFTKKKAKLIIQL